MLTIVVKTFYGLEEVLESELLELGYNVKERLNRAVKLEGDWKDVYYINLHARCAISVLVELRTFEIKTEKDLYAEASKIDWPALFDVRKTFSIKGAVNSSLFKHSQFPFLLIKDAIVDSFRDKVGDRPDVNIKSPHVVIDLYVREKSAVISVNTSGLPLFQRGYRQSTGEAPLNEVVAAALLRMSGWDKKTPLFDPFCGSGTILIEAALLAAGIPSTIERTHYAFKNLKNFDASIWNEMYDAANKIVRELPCKLYGADIDSQMVMKTRRNLRGFPFGRFIEITNDDFNDVPIPEGPGLIITNPPYGERLETDVISLYEMIGSTMKHRMQGYTCWIISSSETGFKSVGLRPERKIKLFNGDLECSFRKFSIYEGSKNAKKD